MSRWLSEGSGPLMEASRSRTTVATAAESRGFESADLDLVQALHQKLIPLLDQERIGTLTPYQARESVLGAAKQILAELAPLLVGDVRDQTLEAVTDEVLGLGPLVILQPVGQVDVFIANASSPVGNKK